MNFPRSIAWLGLAVVAGFITRSGENRLADMADEHDKADRARDRSLRRRTMSIRR